MTRFPRIEAVQPILGLAANGRSQLSVGVRLDNGQMFWGNCLPVPAASRQGETAVFDLEQAIQTIAQNVAPMLQGQPAHAFRPLARQLVPLTESYIYTRTILPTPASEPETVSRRALLMGLREPEQPEPHQEIVTEQRPLPPAIQYGLTTALLRAVAQVHHQTITQRVVAEYELPWPQTAVALHLQVTDKAISMASQMLTSQIAALGYTTSQSDYKTVLGANAERLQQHVRQVRSWLRSQEADYQLAIHLDVQGGLGVLYNNNEGRILGALYGLEQAAKPFLLRVQNPGWLDSREGQMRQLQTLHSYLKMRRMTLQLVADAWVDTPADVVAFAEAGAGHWLHLELPRLGNLATTIEALLHAQAQGVQVLVSGNDPVLTAAIGLATQPALLAGPAIVLHNEMQQTLAAIALAASAAKS